MRKHLTSFQDLVQQNKKQLLEDPKALDEIEKRLEDRQMKASLQHVQDDPDQKEN
ncbi:FbpB family small basic protein [Halalkalibacter sp. AB-rgal2]|uniref:FbpB family small basic protein n=1 Tax=Halalkalibacter hemicellulosilyticusJCM 9152 TaxID=1236971 RepID=W4QGR4_9BACI|nr:FbpB family small basic protein [Halalkalibacter hemicellulosilyticus]GAE31107.1 hypothetical protein JCM9152_2549 [Halalkalibacter hemicellulosilyticusJCM 9152]